MLKWFSLFFIVMFYINQAFAVGFEQARLHSHLGEPLNISIPLVLDERERSEKTKVVLASVQDYKILEQMLPKSYPLLQVDVNKDSPQRWEVLVTSSQAIDESFLVIVLKVQRGRGNFFKKVQVFLDPVSNGPSQKKAVWSNAESTVASATPEAQFVQKNAPSPQLENTAPVSMPVGWARRNSYGPVQSGDSLSEIAYRLRKDKRWSNREIMLALYEKNPDAFANQNINQLKKGSFLQVPDDAEVQAFIQSPRYQALKPMLAVKTKRKSNQVVKKDKKPLVMEKENTPKSYHGKISLGLSESLDAPMVDAIMLDKLQKLEPLYQQVMATDLRIDSIGGKVDNLASEVRSLHEKVDALSASGLSGNNNETSYGWIWFMILLVANILLLLFYLYRKQMSTWQDKLAKAQQKDSYGEPTLDEGHAVMASPFVDNKHQEEDVIGDPEFDPTKLDLDFYPLKEQALSEHVDSDVDDTLFIPDSGEAEEAKPEEPINYTIAFEDAVHKKDWDYAQQCYDLIDDTERNRPRIQALYIQKLHGEGSLIERNNTLLKLFKKYKSDQWNRFCSFFDEDIWSQLQDQNIINFMGNVIEAEVDRVNLMLEDQADESKNVLDLSEADLTDISVSDFPTFKEERDSEIRPVEKVDDLANDISDKTVVMTAEELAKWGKIEEDASVPDILEINLDEGDFDMGSVSDNEVVDQPAYEPGSIDIQLPDEENIGSVRSRDDLLDDTVIRDDDETKKATEALKQSMSQSFSLEETALEFDGSVDKKI